MKKLQRLLFLQGNKCFFCGESIPDGEASVEHLDALSNGGKNSDENSVVCCKAVNAVLGSLSVKEKFRAVLSHEGVFSCPMKAGPPQITRPNEGTIADAGSLLPAVVENLRKRGAARPKKAATLQKSVAASFPQASPKVVESLLSLLKEQGYTAEDGGTVSYPGFSSES